MVGMAVMPLAVGDIGAVVYGVGRITGNNQYVQASNDIMVVWWGSNVGWHNCYICRR